MTSKIAVKTLIDEVCIEYKKCWSTLIGLKDFSVFSDEGFLNFQPNLASALFRLGEMYCALSTERTKLIAKKKRLSTEWFKKRLRSIAAYQHTIKEVINLGKALGDSFAWAFYRNDRDFLEKHFQHPQNLHIPTGIGGRGELEFIRNVKSIQGQMVLYHGITTFLRIGDVSLIDLEKDRVTAIGELKSKMTEPNRIYVGMYFGGPNLDQIMPPSVSGANSIKFSNVLTPEIEKNLWKQLDRIGDSFDIRKADKKMEYRDDTQIDALCRLAKKLESGSGGYERAGDGLLLIGIRNTKAKSLSSKFLMSPKSVARFRAYLNKRFPDLVDQARSLIDRGQVNTSTNANSFFTGHLTPYAMLGAMPLFWRSIPIDFLRKIFFREVTVNVIYNPAHLIRRLRELGYEVELVDNGRRHRVSKRVGNNIIEVTGMEYFEKLITYYLMHEDAIIEMFSEILRQAEAGEVQPYSKIDLRMQQH